MPAICYQHALNRDDDRYLPQEYFHFVGKDVTSSVYIGSRVATLITPDEDTRLECRNAGS